ncbi:MAG: hypothetical protein AAFW89_07680 [Bacteroidota bacterium]
MKHTLFISILSLFLLTSTLFAQSANFDAERMNRDLRIMENILSELFQAESIVTSKNEGRNVFFPVNSRSSDIHGTHLPGYGVIFMVPTNSPVQNILIENGNKLDFSYSFVYSTDGEKDVPEVNEASVNKRMAEFLKSYAPTIGQLNENEQVLIVFGSKNNNHNNRVLLGRVRALSESAVTVGGVSGTNPTVRRLGTTRTESDEEIEELPIYSASVSKKDLNDYRSGKLNDESFQKRIRFARSSQKEELDLKVMSNIFTTALETGEKKGFRSSDRNTNYLFLNNFGALFNIDVRYRSTSNVYGRFSSSFDREFSRAQYGFDKEEEKEAYNKYLSELQDAYNTLKNTASEVLIDYGRTLSSVTSDQYILVTLNINGHALFPELLEKRNQTIPDRIDFQIKKSILEDLDRGRITREQALNRITMKEYS